jgi:Resolvase, N terminal domain
MVAAWSVDRLGRSLIDLLGFLGELHSKGVDLFLHSRRDMVLVAAAGPSINIGLALVAALTFHLVGYLPDTVAQWLAENLRNALIIKARPTGCIKS